ncbi:UDP-N-acetyl-D-mannosaminuronic acid transferase [Rhodomicrobium udaipurense JA643]|uniref:WecB/TagA/CpsF family glycosyltransferase n=1 Tax=Rhodomicrobium udaipurense TaxID=1202716 RepID=A0A8I1KIZ0_9HYPH|nr:WecB/TagA/CpsF family glycosyltransferase [Rhodomicrobium udaipurense]KAI95216.1 UDP-N-acetyl-D-mannosaminuronic acid transferase [Rhodomicrobium udaipurense JA643]MBJ7542276.1 WecB/TagA/CpsF family glycosyltransferase [Rhodomicrobium udaipurense]
MSESRTLLGVDFEVCARNEAVARIDRAFVDHQQLKLAFANAHTLNLASERQDFRNALSRFLVFNDGLGVDLASRIKFGAFFPENLNGTDFVPHYLSTTRHPLRIFFLGGAPGVAEAAADRLVPPGSRHDIAGCHHGYFDAGSADRVLAGIRLSQADLVLVAMGNPLQELWIDRHAEATSAPVLMGVGALFDFASGRLPRAPGWVRAGRVEWLYRLAREPRRLGSRYIVGNWKFLRRVARDRASAATAPSAPTGV